MYQKVNILNSKLLIPHTADIIKRQRLYPFLLEIPKKKLTTVTAGAGYGKTTLIAEVSQYLGINTLWYRLEKSDNNFTTFMSYLFAGTEKYFSWRGLRTLRKIKNNFFNGKNQNEISCLFLSRLEKNIKKELIIVLDDYHFIQENAEINKALEFIIENLPRKIHMVIISRAELPLELSRLRARRYVLDISSDAIAFTIPEVKQLYEQIFNISLTDHDLTVLHNKTHGWVSGLILFYHSIKRKSPIEIQNSLSKLRGSDQSITIYLEENIYNLQKKAIKEFLIKTSILSRINIEFCDQLLGIKNSKEILKSFEKNHLFTFTYSNEEKDWYYYHNLFQEFLQTKLYHELDRKTILNLHKKAAKLWEKNNEDGEALGHYLASEEFEIAGNVFCKTQKANSIDKAQLELIGSNFIISYLKGLPDNSPNKNEWVQYMKGRYAELSHNVEEAVRCYHKAYKSFNEYEYYKGASVCLTALGYNIFLSNDLAAAKSYFKEMLKHSKKNPLQYADILGYLVLIFSFSGKISVANNYYSKAIAPSAASNNRARQAWLFFCKGIGCVFTGEIIKAREFGEKALERCEDMDLVRLLAVVQCLISLCHYLLGSFSIGIKKAKKGLDLIEKNNLHSGYRAWLLLASALNAAALGSITEAIFDGQESQNIFQKIGSRWNVGFSYYVLYLAFMTSDNLLESERCARSGLELIKGIGLPFMEGLLITNMAECLLDKKEIIGVPSLLEEAKRLFMESKFGLSRVHFCYARFYWEKGEKKTALGSLKNGLQLCEENQYDIRVVAEKNRILPIMIELYSKDQMKNYLHDLFIKIDLYDIEELTYLRKNQNKQISKTASVILDEIKKEPAPGLQVHCLGEFKVFLNDKQISSDKWKSKKAKMIFKYLLYSHGRGYLTKDVLMELLWPGEAPQQTAHRLQVALSSLRKILEPKISKGTPSSYILRDGDSYKLDPGDDAWVDIDEFKDRLKLAKEEINPEMTILHYLNAEALYCGDFFEEDLYVQWCADERMMLREEYMDLLRKIIKYYESKKNYVKCIEFTRKYIEKDKFDEIIYQQLMRYYSFTNNKAMVHRTFEKCKESIHREFDTPLSEDTEELFRKLAQI